jgi:hypothetical protein
MLKIIIGSYIGCLFAGFSLWFVQQQYYLYKVEEVKATIVLDKHKNDERKKTLVTSIENSKIERSAKLCLNEATKYHQSKAVLKNIARRGSEFVAINYFINNNVLHAQCYINDHTLTSFKVID